MTNTTNANYLPHVITILKTHRRRINDRWAVKYGDMYLDFYGQVFFINKGTLTRKLNEYFASKRKYIEKVLGLPDRVDHKLLVKNLLNDGVLVIEHIRRADYNPNLP